MMKKILVGLFLALALILFSYYQNSPVKNLAVFKGIEMNVPYTVHIGHPLTSADRKKADLVIKDTFNTVDSIFNVENKNSEIAKLNKLPAFTAVTISEELERLFLIVDRVYFLTKGLFDPTVEPLLNIWKENLKSKTLPTKEEVEALKSSIGWSKVHFKGRVFYKENSGVRIDLGGISKGYLVDMLSQNLQEAGFQNIFVEWGGKIKAHGKSEDRPWKVFINQVKDEDPDHALDYVELDGKALATSGDHVQKWKVQDCGKDMTFCHIMNPMQWKPLQVTQNSVSRVTVKLSSCAIADSVATALMLSDTKSNAMILAESIRKELNEGEFWIYTAHE